MFGYHPRVRDVPTFYFFLLPVFFSYLSFFVCALLRCIPGIRIFFHLILNPHLTTHLTFSCPSNPCFILSHTLISPSHIWCFISLHTTVDTLRSTLMTFPILLSFHFLVLHVLAYDSHNDLDHAIRFTHDFLNHSHVYCVKPDLGGWSSVYLEATIPSVGRPRCRYVMGGKWEASLNMEIV